jgi:hypothetical protein
MPETLFGLPTHVLVVHAVVVFGPLAALTAIAYAAVPRLRENLRWWLAGFAVLLGITSFVAAEVGESLEHQLLAAGATRDTPVGQRIHEHAEAGDVMKVAALLFMVFVLVAVFYLLPAKGGGTPGGLRAATAAVLVLASLFVLYQVAVTGHSGSAAVWTT